MRGGGGWGRREEISREAGRETERMGWGDEGKREGGGQRSGWNTEKARETHCEMWTERDRAGAGVWVGSREGGVGGGRARERGVEQRKSASSIEQRTK